MGMAIFHITPADEWRRARQAGIYRPASLAAEGFIHCSTAAQVESTLRRYFQGQSELLLLEIDVDQAGVPLRWETAPGGEEEFPHLYGALNPAAVIAVHELVPGAALRPGEQPVSQSRQVRPPAAPGGNSNGY